MKALVTGGGGFLGKAIVKLLLERRWQVRSFSRGDYPELRRIGVEVRRGDIAELNAVIDACLDCEIVFHVAAKPGIHGSYDEYHKTNLIGTRNVIDACRKLGISRLVHTSSASVVFNGRDMEGVNEGIPYPKHFEAHYPKTKAMAERLVIEANDGLLATVSLRPHLIWGPEDNQLIPRILARARQLRVIGDGSNKVDTIYIDNAADAHLLAAERLQPGSSIAGKCYFVTQGDPRPLWDIVNRILGAAGLPPITRSVSPRVALAAGAALELIHRVLRLETEPRMTRFLARELSTSHWFDTGAARRDLGFMPRISFDEGITRLETWLRETGRRA